MATTPCTTPIDPFALGFVPWSVQPEQQMLAKVEAKKKADDENDDGSDDDEDPDEDPDEDDPDADKDEDELREELKRTRAALTRANGQGARQRKRRQTLQEQVDELREQLTKGSAVKKPAAKTKAADDDEPRVDAEAIRQQEREKVERERDTDLKRSETKAALLAAGVTPANVKLLLPQVDLDELDVDPKTRDVDGIDAELDRLRTEHGNLFSGKRPVTKRVAGQEDEKVKGGSSKGKTASERQAAMLMGGR